MPDKPQLDSARFHFLQDGNTLGTTGDTEGIDIELLTQIPDEEPFFVIRTEGWSFDGIDDLVVLAKRCLDAFGEVGK